MRIIAGTAGSLQLQVPKNLTRPTTDRVREALFSSLGPKIEGAKVLDLFAGSGALGIESLSRGAKTANFVESSNDACRVVAENLVKAGLEGGTVQHRDVFGFLSSLSLADSFDLIFADPPYARDEATSTQITQLLSSKTLRQSLSPDGLFIIESFAKAPLPDSLLWEVAKEKIYGKTRVSFLVPKS
ncbi:MAG: 16S rRNA (guanine(966)-N(2))-methyltransferase RsmD [Verrucomicrobiales bacterium]|nr:16S rRNA (guanine(966)-N(2))-methyltransferase RsmD [Verrucomicrobiales bacterium]|tara:strand:- start:40380 stop:40937 length:558 start_codon:yes stop_codon:yes gene_type:complete